MRFQSDISLTVSVTFFFFFFFFFSVNTIKDNISNDIMPSGTEEPSKKEEDVVAVGWGSNTAALHRESTHFWMNSSWSD
jgi:hypothetical protein